MSHNETRVLTAGHEIVLLSGDGQSTTPQRLREVAVRITAAEPNAIVITDPDGALRLAKLDANQMREHGWVRVEEVDALRRRAQAARR